MTKLKGVGDVNSGETLASSRKTTRTASEVFKVYDEVIVNILPDGFNKNKYPCTTAGKVILYIYYTISLHLTHLCTVSMPTNVATTVFLMHCNVIYTCALQKDLYCYKTVVGVIESFGVSGRQASEYTTATCEVLLRRLPKSIWGTASARMTVQAENIAKGRMGKAVGSIAYVLKRADNILPKRFVVESLDTSIHLGCTEDSAIVVVPGENKALPRFKVAVMNDTDKVSDAIDKRICKWFDKDVIITQTLQRKVADTWVSVGVGNGSRHSNEIIPTASNSGYAHSTEFQRFASGQLGLWRLKFSLKTPIVTSDLTNQVGIDDAYVHFNVQAGSADGFTVSIVPSNSTNATANTGQYHVWKLGDKADVTITFQDSYGNGATASLIRSRLSLKCTTSSLQFDVPDNNGTTLPPVEVAATETSGMTLTWMNREIVLSNSLDPLTFVNATTPSTVSIEVSLQGVRGIPIATTASIDISILPGEAYKLQHTTRTISPLRSTSTTEIQNMSLVRGLQVRVQDRYGHDTTFSKYTAVSCILDNSTVLTSATATDATSSSLTYTDFMLHATPGIHSYSFRADNLATSPMIQFEVIANQEAHKLVFSDTEAPVQSTSAQLIVNQEVGTTAVVYMSVFSKDETLLYSMTPTCNFIAYTIGNDFNVVPYSTDDDQHQLLCTNRQIKLQMPAIPCERTVSVFYYTSAADYNDDMQHNRVVSRALIGSFTLKAIAPPVHHVCIERNPTVDESRVVVCGETCITDAIALVSKTSDGMSIAEEATQLACTLTIVSSESNGSGSSSSNSSNR
jgi:hypothetical protein